MDILKLKRDEVIDALRKHLDPQVFRHALSWSTPQLKATLTLYESGEQFEKMAEEKTINKFVAIDSAEGEDKSVILSISEGEVVDMRQSQKNMFLDRLFNNVLSKLQK
jgi:hypothetical protein